MAILVPMGKEAKTRRLDMNESTLRYFNYEQVCYQEDNSI